MKVTGLFFKKLSYPYEKGLGTAPVIVAKTIDYYGAAAGGPGMTDIHPPTALDNWKDREETNKAVASEKSTPVAPATSFRDILSLAGWDVKRLAEFDDAKPLSDEQRAKSLDLLRRLRTFGSGNLDD
jgi:hypothetical protein